MHSSHFPWAKYSRRDVVVTDRILRLELGDALEFFERLVVVAELEMASPSMLWLTQKYGFTPTASVTASTASALLPRA
jgi:hypothetical protein